MKKTRILRLIALALCLALAGLAGLAEDWEGVPELIDAPIPEAPEFALEAPEDPAPDATPESPAQTPAEGQPENGAATPEPPAEATPEPSAPQRRFNETVRIESETWRDLELLREEGFTGPFARVDGLLTLSNVQIEGKPAREADLAAAFELGPTGAVALEDGAPLSANLCAFSFNKGSEKTLKLTWNGVALKAKKARWKSSNSKVAKVSSAGKVTARKKGVATITASYGGESVACRVVVTDIPQVKSVKLSASKKTLPLNTEAKLKVTIKPANAPTTLKWKSSRPSVVSVDENGRIAGFAGGSAKITVTAANGKSASCTVTVKEVKPKRVDFKQLYVTMNPGATCRTKAILKPEDVSNPRLIYKSSDKSVATIDEEGTITAVGCGTATITAVADADSKVKNTCKVCVIQPDAKRMEGLIIGINPGHQIKTNAKQLPIAPGSHETAKAIKTGACGKWTRVNEYETVLQIGLKLADLLSKEGATVVITRTSNDVMLTNIERAKKLNDAGVDVALQLHCNSTSNKKSEGCSGYIRTTGNWVEESRALSKAMVDAISKETGCVNLGVKVYNKYMSLNWSTTPAVLLEMGYLSNQKEDRLLATDSYRAKMARGILEGLCDYFGR